MVNGVLMAKIGYPALNLSLTIRAANSAYRCGARCFAVRVAKGRAHMAIADLPALSALRTKMQWHQQRQRVLAENISHSDTPNFKPRDLEEPKFTPAGSPTGASGALAL